MLKQDKFSKWLEKGLSSMQNEKAYCLNLFDEDEEWTCELVATDKFYQDNNDWYFDETKVYNREKPFTLISKYKKGNFQDIFKCFSKFLSNLIQNNPIIRKIVQNKTFAYGFVDGDLSFIDTQENELC